MKRAALMLLCLALLTAGCGSKKESAPELTVRVLPDARTAGEWAGRIVKRFVRPMNRDIQTLLTLNNPQTKIYIFSGDPTATGILRQRMNDMAKCNSRLTVIGPPPASAVDARQLTRIDSDLHRACDHYTKVSALVLDGLKLLASGRSDVIQRGRQKLRDAVPDALAGAKAYDNAIKTAQKLEEFLQNGLKPSA